MTALHCQEPDRVPLGEWEIDRAPKEGFLGRKIENLNDEIEFWLKAGFDYVTAPPQESWIRLKDPENRCEAD